MSHIKDITLRSIFHIILVLNVRLAYKRHIHNQPCLTKSTSHSAFTLVFSHHMLYYTCSRSERLGKPIYLLPSGQTLLVLVSEVSPVFAWILRGYLEIAGAVGDGGDVSKVEAVRKRPEFLSILFWIVFLGQKYVHFNFKTH